MKGALIIMKFVENGIREDERNIFIFILMGIYVISVGIGVPLVFWNKYFDILVTKYYYYCACTIVMFVFLGIYLFLRWHKEDKVSRKNIIRRTFNQLTWTDYSVLLFYLIAFISAITSYYRYESFWGNEGRYTGLFLITCYVVSYFCISKFWIFKARYIDIFLITGILVCIFGITDYFKLDILKFKVLMIEGEKNNFTSTIGNINTYTAYVGIIVAISAVLFLTAKDLKRMLFYFSTTVISFFAIVMGVSDNAYLSLGALFAFLPLYIFRNNEGLKRYVVLLAAFFSVIQAIGSINKYFADQVIGIDSSFKLLLGLKGLTFFTVGLWVIVIFFYIIDYYRNKRSIEYGNKLCYIWLMFLIAIGIGVIYALYDCNIAGNADKYGSLSSYLLFNDEWGTHRGYIWRNALECFLDLSWWKKLVGYGPETFGILMLQKTANNPYNELFDNAHNEYLHLLTTVGIAGLLSYINFIIAIVFQAIKRYSKNTYIMAVVFGIICYSVQALVNLNLPIVTPVFWVLLAIASAKSLEVE
jgi:hypothetical protein